MAGSVTWADEVSVEELIGNLKSSDESARLQAIDQLALQGAKAAEAVAPLMKLLKDSSAKVRAHAAGAGRDRRRGQAGRPRPGRTCERP